MSSKPYPEGVTKVLEQLRLIEQLEAEVRELTPKAQRLEKAHEELGAARAQIEPLMRSMDVDSPGNYGWGGRFGWFLGELRRQIIETQRKGGR